MECWRELLARNGKFVSVVCMQVYLWRGWSISPKDLLGSSASHLWKMDTVIWCSFLLSPQVCLLFLSEATENCNHLASFSQIQRRLMSHGAASNVFVRPMVTQSKFWCWLVMLNGKGSVVKAYCFSPAFCEFQSPFSYPQICLYPGPFLWAILWYELTVKD